MKEKIKWSLCILFILCANSLFAQTTSREYERSGNFSYLPPLNWTVTEFPGLVYKVVFGPSEEGFAANIVFVTERFDGNLSTYVNANISNLPVFFSQYKLISRDEFNTNSGIVGERVILNNVQNGISLRQTFYFFQLSRNNFIVITCSVLEKVSARFASIFDESMRTVELIN